MAVDVECPECGERERLKGERSDERIFVNCEACGHRWERHTDRCPSCGRRSLVPVRVPVLQKARGTQQSIVGYRMAKQCNSCDWASEGPPETSAV